LITEFVGDEWEEMRAVFYRSMRGIKHALSAKREYLTKDGQIMQGGPDHYARLAATKHLRDFLMASRQRNSHRLCRKTMDHSFLYCCYSASECIVLLTRGVAAFSEG
jgi:hypothetical protein